MRLHTARRNLVSRSRHSRHLATSSPLVIGIRREDPSRIWERRVPLTPDAVKSLVSQHGVKVLLQPCARRVFPTYEYTNVGAQVSESLADANIVLGIKETPLTELLTDSVGGAPRTHFMFSHTAKGQSYNMPLLSRFTQSTARLIDYELLTNSDGKRTVAFGWYAGAAGVPEALSALAHDHLTLGVSSPFLLLPRPYNHRDLKALRQSLRDVGALISQYGAPEPTGPYIVALTGSGNVSQGALDLLKELPIRHVQVADLPRLASSPGTSRKYVYLVHLKPEDYLVDIRGEKYNRRAYYSHPEMFNSLFYQRVAPYISLLINGVGWKPGYPRLMNNVQLAHAQALARQVGGARFRVVADISCDIEGGLEFVSRAATIDDPVFTARPADHPQDLPGIQVMSVDILPSEIPLDSSRHFSDKLLPYIKSLVRAQQGGTLAKDDLVHLDTLQRGTIAQNGKLQEPHSWLASRVTSPESSSTIMPVPADPNPPTESTTAHASKKRRILLLGSGMVARPAINHLATRKDVEVLVASNDVKGAAALVASHDNASAVGLNVTDEKALQSLVGSADLVISLLPVSFHATVAKACIFHKKHLVTASYISPEMKALHNDAVNADVLLLNEIGLDPGIDHCSAVDLCEQVRSQGRDIVSFVSVCGGLPAPEDSNVPLGYKFSWSPRGVLTAALNGAMFRLGGKDFNFKAGALLESVFPDIPLVKGLSLECLPNRDSLSYAPTYGLGPVENLESIFRGTLRYKGFSSLMKGFSSAGLLDLRSSLTLNSRGGWQSLLAQSLSQVHQTAVQNNRKDISAALRTTLTETEANDLLEAAEWLSMTPPFSSVDSLPAILPLVPTQPTSPLDLFARLLAHKLRYLPGEQDTVVLSHEIISRPTGSRPDHQLDQIHTSTLILRQPHPEVTAMAMTVSLPLAIAALRVLDGKVQMRGVAGPTADKEIYKPVLQEMGDLGLMMKEETRRRLPGKELASGMLGSWKNH